MLNLVSGKLHRHKYQACVYWIYHKNTSLSGEDEAFRPEPKRLFEGEQLYLSN